MPKKRKTDLVLYRFFAESGELLYIGKSMRVWHRFTDHKHTSTFYPQAASVTLERGFANDADLSAAEIAAIQAEQPLFNQRSKVRPAKIKRDPVIDAELHPCGIQHFCGWHSHQGRIDSCRERDEMDFDIVARLDAGETAVRVARRHSLTVDQVIYTAHRIRSGRERGQHGCIECPANAGLS